MRTLLAPLFAGLVFLTGCAGHESRVKAALDALDGHQPQTALASLNEEMDLESSDQLPEDMRGDDALLVLDRGTIQLSLGDYKRSVRDLTAADKGIDLLSMSRDAGDDLGKYLFSDDVGPYKAPAYEKLMINTLGLVGFLAQRNLEDAKVEGRRLAITQKVLEEAEEEGTNLLSVGSYLAGFAFEKSGKNDEALLFYEEALNKQTFPSLRDPLRVLTRGEPKTPQITELVGQSGALDSVAATKECDLLVLVAYGRVPQKEPRRIPVGLALTLASRALSPNDRAQANELAAKGLVTWVNYPALGDAKGTLAKPSVSLNGKGVGVEHALDVEGEVRRAYAEQEGAIVASAIVRMITRIAVSEGAHAIGRASDGGGRGKKKSSTGATIGLIAGLAAAATMTVADTPDTRSWSTLPARMELVRIRIPAGSHTLRVDARGSSRDIALTAAEGGWLFVPVFVLR